MTLTRRSILTATAALVLLPAVAQADPKRQSLVDQSLSTAQKIIPAKTSPMH